MNADSLRTSETGSGGSSQLGQQSGTNTNTQSVVPDTYSAANGALYRSYTYKGELRETCLGNFVAQITAEVVEDDGLETHRRFEISAHTTKQRFNFSIPASEFARMDWPIEQMGAKAIVYPRQKESMRTAIQQISKNITERRVYTHTGWRETAKGIVYLHAGGAIGKDGAVAGIEVRLPATLSRFTLRLPKDSEALRTAIRASLRLMDLGPKHITGPLLAAVYRAVLSPTPDFGLHVSGPTGVFKTEIAALAQRHFGADMDRTHLPGSWSSTPNATEIQMFHAKDALVVVDDFAPQGSGFEVAKYNASAERLFRSVGNGAGRNRLDANSMLRTPKPPRGLVISTGEDVPRGQSIRGRMLIVELTKGDINPADLTRRQEDAANGLYVESLGAFVQWLAGRYSNVQEEFRERVLAIRNGAKGNRAHARTPEIVANLQAAFELFLRFAEESGAITHEERLDLEKENWQALGQAGALQTTHQCASEPTEVFLALIKTALVSGRAYLAAPDGTMPTNPDGSWDLTREFVRTGDLIGWVDGEDVYLDPGSAYATAQRIARDSGESIPITRGTLIKRLHEKGLLASVDDARKTLTVRRTLDNARRSVLHLRREAIVEIGGEHESGE